MRIVEIKTCDGVFTIDAERIVMVGPTKTMPDGNVTVFVGLEGDKWVNSIMSRPTILKKIGWVK